MPLFGDAVLYGSGAITIISCLAWGLGYFGIAPGARSLYERSSFQRNQEEPHHRDHLGRHLLGQRRLHRPGGTRCASGAILDGA